MILFRLETVSSKLDYPRSKGSKMEAQTKKSSVPNEMERRENSRNQTKTKNIERNTDTERMELEEHDKQRISAIE